MKKINNKIRSMLHIKCNMFFCGKRMEVFFIEKLLLISSVICSWFAFLIGGWHISLTILAVFMVIDIVTGVMKAIVTKEVNSKIGYKGFIRKGGIMLVLIIANLLDVLTGSEFLFRTMAVLFYIGLESLSIIENLGHIGVPLPKGITKYLQQLSEERDDEK